MLNTAWSGETLLSGMNLPPPSPLSPHPMMRGRRGALRWPLVLPRPYHDDTTEAVP